MDEGLYENFTDYEGEEYLGDMIGEIEEQVMKLVRENPGNNKVPTSLWETWKAFSSAVNWNERWIQALVAFHVVLLTVVLLCRNNENAQVVLFLCVCALVYFCERINSYCAEHWTEFSTQNYFDEHGLFAGVMFAGPLLCIGLLQLINFLRLTSNLLIKSKRMQLRAQAANRAKRGDEDKIDGTVVKDDGTQPSVLDSEQEAKKTK